jgi:hypothetical protein
LYVGEFHAVPQISRRSARELKFAINRTILGETFEITKQLPENRGEYEYRIKSISETHERVARESELRGV